MIQDIVTWLADPNSTFWPLLLIILLLRHDITRVPAVVFLALRCSTGSFSYLSYVALAVLIALNWAMDNSKNSLDKHIKHTKRIDPDYQ